MAMGITSLVEYKDDERISPVPRRLQAREKHGSFHTILL